MIKLTLGSGNGKMKKLAEWLGIPYSHIKTFDLPAGYTCEKANICKSFANRKTGKIRQTGSVLCYASKAERYLPNVREARWQNYLKLLALGNDVEAIVEVLLENIGKYTEIVRVHSSGEFYSPMYFKAWLIVAEMLPKIKFFAYTKHLAYAIAEKPSNFKIQYSFGGLDDDKFNEMVKAGAQIPVCRIGEYKGQYEEEVVCGVGGEHEDFVKIFKNESFVIDAH